MRFPCSTAVLASAIAIFSLPAAATVIYDLHGYIDYAPPTAEVGFGDEITGRLLWSPETAFLRNPGCYSKVFTYEILVGAAQITSQGTGSEIVCEGSSAFEDDQPAAPFLGYLDELTFQRSVPLGSLTADLSGSWALHGSMMWTPSWRGLIILERVPEPSTLALLGLGLLGVCVGARRRAA